MRGVGLSPLTRIDNNTPIKGTDGCLDLLRTIFLEDTSILTRRYNFFRATRKPGEIFRDWYARLQLEGEEAELDSVKKDDLYVMLLIVGERDKELRKEFLRQDKPTKEDIVRIGKNWESAEKQEDNLVSRSGSSTAAAISSYRRGRSPHRSNPKSSNHHTGKCPGCGRPQGDHSRKNCPAQGKTCHTCGKKHHFSSVCMSGKSSRPRSQSKGQSKPIQAPLINVKLVKGERPTPRTEVEVSAAHGTSFKKDVLPDTGATETIISEDLIRANGILIDSSRKRDIFAANNSKLRCSGSVDITVSHLGKYHTCIEAYVTPDITDQLIISWHGMIELGMIPKSFPFLPEDKTAQVSAVPSPKPKKRSKSATVSFSDAPKLSAKAPKSPVRPVKSTEEEPTVEEARKEIDKLFAKYPSVFESADVLQPMKGDKMHIHLREDIDIKPTHINTARNIPFAYRDKAKAELDYMVRSGIIEPVQEPSTWISPCLIVPKPNGNVRIVVDYTGLNKYIKRPVHPFPSPQYLSGKIPASAKWFLVLDAVKGYWQVELDEESRALTTFITPFGCFRFCRAPMGLSASGDEFGIRGDRAFDGLEGQEKIIDDLIVYGDTFSQLHSRAEEVLKRAQAYNITLSKSKIQFGHSVKFAGYVVSSGGISSDPSKTDAISKFPVPTNVTDLRSFIGLVNQLGQFVPDLAHVLQPLRGLLKKSNVYQWLPEHQEAFDKAKAILTSPSVLAHFNPKLPTTLLTDASRLRGIGFALTQTKPDGSTSLIQCGSRFLTDAETRYAVCELEALAIQWAIIKCRTYLLGTSFTVITDHKPLLGIFKGSNLDAIDNPRLQRIVEKLAGYTFQVQWTPGKQHQIADALSRAPVFDPEETGQGAVLFSTLSVMSDLALQEISTAAKHDSDYQAVIAVLTQGKSVKKLPASHPAKLYMKHWDDLSLDQESGLLILHGHRIIVPQKSRSKVLHQLHESHQGLRRTLRHARQLYFWPGMTNDINQVVTACQSCQEQLPSQPREPLIHTTASRPFEAVSVDLFDLAGKSYLVMVDRYSGWPCVAKLSRTDTKVVTDTLADWFVDYGIPLRIRSDGGPQFRTAFSEFCKGKNIIHEISAPYHPQSNGHAESAVKAMKTLLAKHNSNWTAFRSSLLQWRNVPRTDGLSPSQWLFGRSTRSITPTHPSQFDRIPDQGFTKAESRREEMEEKTKKDYNNQAHELPKLHLGSQVRVQDHQTGKWDTLATVKEVCKNGRSYEIEFANGRTSHRNRRRLRPAQVQAREEEDQPRPLLEPVQQDEKSAQPRRSNRIRRQPDRLNL